jgi:hypothetical protein
MDGMQRFHDRREAGQFLARRLADYKNRDDAGNDTQVLNDCVVTAYTPSSHKPWTTKFASC